MKTRWITGLSLLLLLAAAGEFFWLRYDAAAVQSGEVFLYWLYVERTARAPSALVSVVVAGSWLFLRGIVPLLAAVRPLAVLLLVTACCFFSVLMPLAGVTSGAHHVQSVASSAHTWHLYYQLQGIGVQACSHVLVRCDRTGWLCQAVEQWQVGSVCLGDYAPISLQVEESRLIVRLNGEQILTDAE